MAENNTNAPLIETSAVGFTYQGSEKSGSVRMGLRLL